MLVRLGLAVALLWAPSAIAQTIYPLTRAEILAGSKFDLKVEFPGTPAQAKVTINGRDAAEVIGIPAQRVPNEDGFAQTAYWIRDAHLKAGTYVVEATADGKSSSVTWEVFATPKPRVAKNVILFIGDGLSIAHRTAARIVSRGMVEGRYGGELEIDRMPHMALISTAGSDSIVTDSANAMSAYTTGHKTCVNALGVYCANNKNTLDHPKVETITEAVKRRLGMAVGVITNTEIEDATPAGMVAHTRRRADYPEIVQMFFATQPEVIMGGGSPWFLPKSVNGSRRPDEADYFRKFEDAGYAVAETDAGMKAAGAKPQTKRLLGLFNTGNVDGALDRFFLKKGTVSRFPDQPDLVDQVKVSLEVLTRHDKGFVLMVESGRIDKYSHSMDPERAIYDTIMLDNAVKAAKDFAALKNDTLIIVVADHAHPISVIGTYDDARPGSTPREKLGIYDRALMPNYPPADAQGYPPSVAVSRRLALGFAAFPDHCYNAQPFLDGENMPAVAGKERNTYVANEKYCTQPGAVRIEGNLPREAASESHSGDDVLLTAMGPGAEMFHGRLDNTRVFRVMVTALGLGEE